MLPVFPSIAAFVASLVGYQVPVVCQPLPHGTVVQATIASTAPDYTPFSGTVSWPPTPGDEAGITGFVTVPPGASVTVTVGGQSISLPATPAETPATNESPPSGGETGWIEIPAFIVLDQSMCDGWTGDDPAARGRALLTAIHEGMHARWADGDEALTECRALQAFPTELSSLFPALPDPGGAPVGPGAAPPRPRLAARTPAWRRAHPQAERQLRIHWQQQLVRWRQAYGVWQQVDGQWQQADSQWLALDRSRSAQQTEEAQMTAAAVALDAAQPAQYHGATC